MEDLPFLDRVAPEKRNKRMEICEECDNFTEERRCSECGCVMDIKTFIPFMKCPVGKW